ncbi:Glycosyl hydrolase [Planctomycetales bacterium 10988]|nr:Glycosyl hydrolase [Planctomycetales bacterium 10988]
MKQLGLTLVLSCFVTLGSLQAEESEWTWLFDGENMDHWQNYSGEPIPEQWVIDDGSLHLTGKGGGDLATKEMYENFDLRWEWKISPGGNSGVIYLSRPGDAKPYMSGLEYQILDDSAHKDGANPLTSAGALYALVKPEDKELHPVGEWNTSRIVVKNNVIQHFVNGKKVLQLKKGSKKWDKLVSESKFTRWEQFGKTTKGHIVLQDHTDPVWYRNIRIRELDVE